MPTGDYYQTLEVAISASVTQIKSAYRRLALRYHPDVCKSNENVFKFRQATEAYKVLSDPVLRLAYNNAFKIAGEEGEGNGAFFQSVEPQEGFEWAMRRILMRNPEFEQLEQNEKWKKLWLEKATEYWELDGRRHFRGIYMNFARMAAEIVFSEKCEFAETGMRPMEGIEWALNKLQENFSYLYNKPRYKLLWRVKAERYWVQFGRRRYQSSYVRAAYQAALATRNDLGFFARYLPVARIGNVFMRLFRRPKRKSA